MLIVNIRQIIFQFTLQVFYFRLFFIFFYDPFISSKYWKIIGKVDILVTIGAARRLMQGSCPQFNYDTAIIVATFLKGGYSLKNPVHKIAFTPGGKKYIGISSELQII